jgi:hypothetical protein
MPRFRAKLEIAANARKRKGYYHFDLIVAAGVKLKNLRYYAEEDRVWLPERRVRRRRYLVAEFSPELREDIYRLVRERWGNAAA